MPKQIKLGFDRTYSPKIGTFEPLFDISGTQLRNENNEFLFTEEIASLKAFYFSNKSLSVHVNDIKKFVKVVEQFPETSQVSSSLLGIPRSEELLGLFADVSTYGFNSNIWEFFLSPTIKNPAEWLYRKNKYYGKRERISSVEVSEEQAISLRAFPVPWTFPYGPSFATQGLYNETLYENYVRFFLLGRALYDYYFNMENEALEKFAVDNFLPPETGIYDTAVGEIVYNPNSIDDAFTEIEKWTLAWIKIRDKQLYLPNGVTLEFEDINDILGIPPEAAYNNTNTRPGYSSTVGYYGQIQSKKAFRYQPGKVSGFTFGLRCSSDKASLDNIIEWGCANDTDEYMFQVRGTDFNIVRRSTIPLPEKNLTDMGLVKEDQTPYTSPSAQFTAKLNPETGEREPAEVLYQTVINRDFFNGDKLNGNGPSGYILSVEQVTMYKIEFSWYGAVGAKFYAYVPVGNGEARWVLMHTIIIENKIGAPCLNDPYFKFKYVLNITDTSNLVAPQFVYKYGASYYVDGGDEGSSTSYTTSSEIVQASPLYTRASLGISPKNYILNSDGISVVNKKDVIPENISITTDNPIRVDIIECEGCPGFGHHYAPSLKNGVSGKTGSFIISPTDGKYIQYADETTEFDISDKDKKVIGDGVYSTYIASIDQSNATKALIKRKLRDPGNPPKPSTDYTFEDTTSVVLLDGTTKVAKGSTFDLRLTAYDSVAVSAVGLTKPNIDINFLNPTKRDGRSFAEFYVGVTDKTPSLNVDGNLELDNSAYNEADVLYTEWSNYGIDQDIRGYEYTETEDRYAFSLEIDPQISRPGGVDSGTCSKLSVRVTNFAVDCVRETQNPAGVSGNYLAFTAQSPIASLKGLKGGQIGVKSGDNFVASATYFEEDSATPFRNIPNVGTRYYIKITGDLPGNVGEQQEIAFKLVRVYSRHVNITRVFSFDVYPLYVVVGMRDKAEVNNITIEEYDAESKFTYTPNWLIETDSTIEVVASGKPVESLNMTNGSFENGGLSLQGYPPTNYQEIARLSSANIDKQLQQPLRPSEIKSTFYLGKDETTQINLDYLFAQDRYLITPGLYNTKATFFTVKALKESANTQISLNFKEQ